MNLSHKGEAPLLTSPPVNQTYIYAAADASAIIPHTHSNTRSSHTTSIVCLPCHCNSLVGGLIGAVWAAVLQHMVRSPDSRKQRRDIHRGPSPITDSPAGLDSLTHQSNHHLNPPGWGQNASRGCWIFLFFFFLVDDSYENENMLTQHYGWNKKTLQYLSSDLWCIRFSSCFYASLANEYSLINFIWKHSYNPRSPNNFYSDFQNITILAFSISRKWSGKSHYSLATGICQGDANCFLGLCGQGLIS